MSATPDAVHPQSEAIDVRRKTEDRAAALASRGHSYTAEQINVIKSTVAVGATNEELALFLTVAQRSGLDPFTKQIHFVKRFDSQQEKMVGAFQVGIDGFRVIASRDKRYQGRVGPWWCGKDGQWRDLWTAEEAPFAAKVGIIVEGYREPVYATARWNAYRQTKKSGELTRFWATMGPEQLAKCAEALALRIAFPNDLSGLETDDEMGQADNAEPRGIVQRPAAAAVQRDERLREEATKSVAEVLGQTEAREPVADEPVMPAGDRAEVLAQGNLQDFIAVLGALRRATKDQRQFYDMAEHEGAARWVIVDAEILTAIGRVKNGGPVNTFLDQILRSDKTRVPFCTAVLAVADSLGVEVIR